MAFKMKSPMRQFMFDCPECGQDFETLEEMITHFNSVHEGNLGPDPITKDNTQIQGLPSDDDDKKKDQRLRDE
tara:strand:- start:1424 stop:1642 length:219 start_codon:yes stop_codon:yes gene_type:complete